MVVSRDNYRLFFGDSTVTISAQTSRPSCTAQELLPKDIYEYLQKNVGIVQLHLLEQIHSINGLVIDEKNCHKPLFFAQGDFLLTQQIGIGLGIVTADCLPIIIIDKKNKALGIAHAGWRGSVNNIAKAALTTMQQAFGTKAQECEIIFGPSARTCCYEVDYDVIACIPTRVLKHIVTQRNGTLFCDIPLLNEIYLREIGVSSAAFIREYNGCTICTYNYCSYRREKEKAQRQLTVVSIM